MTTDEAKSLAKQFKTMDEYDIAVKLIQIVGESERRGMQQLAKKLTE